MKNKYETLKAEPRNTLPDIDLVRKPHRGQDMLLAKFGAGPYYWNEQEMRTRYWNSQAYPEVTFRTATTSESISALAYRFTRDENDRENPPIKYLLAGLAVKTEEGLYINPTKAIDFFGRVSEDKLNELRDKSDPVNGILLGDHDFAFVPYSSFVQGPQENEEFIRSGLARGLEHTTEIIAPKLKGIASAYEGTGIFNVAPSKRRMRLIPSVVGFSLSREHFNINFSRVADYIVGYSFGRMV